MSERTQDTIIAEVQKNSRELIRVTQTVYNGIPLVGLRIWWREDAEADWKPSKKGLNFRADIAGKIINALSKAAQEGGEQ